MTSSLSRIVLHGEELIIFGDVDIAVCAGEAGILHCVGIGSFNLPEPSVVDTALRFPTSSCP